MTMFVGCQGIPPPHTLHDSVFSHGSHDQVKWRCHHTGIEHCPDSAHTQGANERVVLCLMNDTTSKSSGKM